MGAEPVVLLLAVVFLPLLAWLAYLAVRRPTRSQGVAILGAATVLGTWGMVADHAVSILGFIVYFALAALGLNVIRLAVIGVMALVKRLRRGRKHAT